tara:strand:+ start:2351 stop:2944 length:594 start_codon:yes stop_codon:yes gene_type:complete
MNWILDNLEKLVPVVITILYFLGSSKTKKAEKQRRAADPKAEERSAKIQEEIRRKILERQQEGQPVIRSSPPEQPYVSEPVLEERYDPFGLEFDRGREELAMYPNEETSASAPVSSNSIDLLEGQRRQIEEQMQKARDLRKQLSAMDGSRSYMSSGGSRLRGIGELSMGLRDDLKNTNSIRRAIVLKEILDTPIALR